jgi:hypothetical protein
MMDDQKILDNAPVGEGIDLVDITGEYFDEHCNHLDSRGLWSPHNIGPVSPRSLADVKRIVELENLLKKFRPMDENGDGWDFVYNEGSEYLGAAVLEALKAGN